jgi:hypothetical protein
VTARTAEDDDFGFPKLDPPSRAHESHLSPSPFVVSLDFFGLDVFERLRAPFMEKQFYREAFLDMRAKSLEADRIRHAHAFHLREMAFEARDFFLAETRRREKSAEAKEEQARARAAEGAEEGADDEGADDEGAEEGANAAADATEDVAEDDVAGEDAEHTPPAAQSSLASAEAEEEDSVPPEVAFPTVRVAGPAFAPASSPWFSPLAPGAAARRRLPRAETSPATGDVSRSDSDSSKTRFSTTGYAYAADAALARASLADPSAVYRKTWERFCMSRARTERDARYYAGEVALTFLDENENENEASAKEDSEDVSVEKGRRLRVRRFHACPLREIWATVRHETWRLNVADLESRLAKLDKIVALAAPAAEAARLAEEAVTNANADPRLAEAREADPPDQNLLKTLEAELAETLAPLAESLEKARAEADAAAEAAATASREAAKLRDELRLLNTRGAFGGDDATAPAKLANDVLKKLTGGVGFSDANVERCCALTEACVESIRAYEAELKAFNENPPVVDPPKPGDDTPPPPPPQPPKRPADVRYLTWRAFETMFMYTDFAEGDKNAGGSERDAAERGKKESKPKGKANDKDPAGASAGRRREEDAIAVAVRRERAEARAKAAARAEAAAARAKAAAEAEAAAREAAGEEPLDPLDAVADPRESAAAVPADSHHPLDASDDDEEAADGTSLNSSRPPLAVVGLPRITPAMLADFAASRAAAEKAALAAAAAAEAKAAKGAKGKKAPAKKPGKKEAPAEEPPTPPPPTARFAAGLFSGDDLLKAAAGVDPNPYVYVPPPEEDDAKK